MASKKELEAENRQLKYDITKLQEQLSKTPLSKESILLEVLNTVKKTVGNIPLSNPMSEKDLDAEFRKWVGNAGMIAIWNKLREIL